MKKKIVLFATGGTIASTGDPLKGNVIATLKGEELINKLNMLSQLDFDVEVINYTTVNSVEISVFDMYDIAVEVKKILERDEVTGVVITHGTSLMEETAFVLDTLIDIDKPVVFTGSQYNDGCLWSDGLANLKDALSVAASPLSKDKGVLVVFSGRIHEGRQIIKKHTNALDAFTSGEAGILGQVYINKVEFFRPRIRKILTINSFKRCSVAIIPFYSGADGRYLRAAIDFDEDGVVIEGVGLGNVNKGFFEKIKELRDKHKNVVITSRSPEGRVAPVYAYGGGGASLRDIGVMFSHLPASKARLMLMLAIGGGYPMDKLNKYFSE